MSLGDKWDDFAKDVMSGVKNLAKDEAQDFIKCAQDDGLAFITQMADNLKEWTEAVARKKLSVDEFKFMVKGQKDLAEMHGLTRLGLSQIRVQRFRDDLADLVVNSALKAVGFR